MSVWKEDGDYIYVSGHRGWFDKYPENTMESFQAALDLGVDQIETDIRVSKDGELVLFHDSSLERTTNGTGLLIEKTLAELKELDAGSHKGAQFAGCRIPTLREFFDLVKEYPEVTLDLEFKEYPTEGREELAYNVCDKILQMVEEYGYRDRIFINTFSGKLHEYVKVTYKDTYRQHVYFPIKNLGTVTEDPYAYAYCSGMFGDYAKWQAYVPEDGSEKEPYLDLATTEECKEMLARGVKCWSGPHVRNERVIDMAIEAGVTLICCNNPDEVLEILRKKGMHK